MKTFPKIEKNIPLEVNYRAGSENTVSGFLRRMSIGDSFELPVNEMKPYESAVGKLPAGAFTIRRLENGNKRCWKLKDTTTKIAGVADTLRSMKVGDSITIPFRRAATYRQVACNLRIKVSILKLNEDEHTLTLLSRP